MPYGIKGKTKKWESKSKLGKEADSRIEDCVSDLMADPDFKPKNKGETKKQAAIKVCKQSITRSKEFQKKLS
ncbi:hypothetical protein AMJ49_06520 [Parcubacteria bacterium DG_74_2]|nr:MAG: hypothetical protein AMJ49_06520 [Parcubacteria bacterium DG_74_2]